jgi:hypothetical protein
MRTLARLMQVFYETPDSGSGGGPVSGGAPAASAPPPSAPAGAAPPVASPAPAAGVPAPSIPGPAGAPPAAATRFSYEEDRGDWVPPHRLSSIAQRARANELRARQLEAMIQAGTGVTIPGQAPEVPQEVRQAREAFAQVFPGLAQLETLAGRLQEMMTTLDQGGQPFDFSHLARVPQIAQGDQARWEQHGAQTLDSIYSDLAADYGADTLTPRQQQAVGREFMAWLEEDQTGARVTRYTRADQTLRTEFLTEYRNGFVNPFRRTADAATLAAGHRNRGLPPAPQVSGVVPPGPPQAPQTIDQVNDQAWRAFQAATR